LLEKISSQIAPIIQKYKLYIYIYILYNTYYNSINNIKERLAMKSRTIRTPSRRGNFSLPFYQNQECLVSLILVQYTPLQTDLYGVWK